MTFNDSLGRQGHDMKSRKKNKIIHDMSNTNV